MILGSKPPELVCWSRQFEDTDDECRRCEHRESCRAEFCKNNGLVLPSQSPMMFAQKPPWAQQHCTPSVAPQPLVPPPVVAQPQQMMPRQMISPMMPVQAQPIAHQNLYEFTPYPGETLGTRLTKNIILKVGAGVATTVGNELGRFLLLFRWPPRLL